MDDSIESDASGINSQSSFDPGQNYSASGPPSHSASWCDTTTVSPDAGRRRVARPVVPSSSIEAGPSSEGGKDSLPHAQESDSQIVAYRPLRMAAVSAHSPIRKHARMDLGYVSDIAQADDSDDSDELDADILQYAPFETQVQNELEDQAWDEIPECEDVGVLNAEATVTSSKLRQLGSTLDTDDYFLLTDYTVLFEYESGSKTGKFLYEEAQDFWRAMVMSTLCSMPKPAIKELMCGNLKQAYDSNPELRGTLDMFAERGKQHPCIYARTLTTADGRSMTTAESLRLARWLQRYVSDSTTVAEHPRCKEAFSRIDNQFRSQWKRVNPNAERAYLASSKDVRLQSRVENVRRFCKELIARCEVSEQEGTPLKPLTYIGYAGRAERRKRQHEACGKSSNWLATLVQAVCNVLWGQKHFQMHFMVVCLLSCEEQGMIAEMLLTRIAGAYYHTGGGFCIDAAGKSMESLYFHDLTRTENTDRWNELHEWVVKHTDLDATQDECVQKMRELLAKNEVMQGEIAASLVQHHVRSSFLKAALAEHREVVEAENPGLAETTARYSEFVEKRLDKAAPLFR